MDLWYFAYGSNMWADQMCARTGSIGAPDHPPRLARLENHRLVFQPTEPGGPAYANILSPGDSVIGVIYRCSPAALELLDGYEQHYHRQAITVVDATGERVEATAYVMNPALAKSFARPSDEYLQRIITGARQFGLPALYIEAIARIASDARG